MFSKHSHTKLRQVLLLMISMSGYLCVAQRAPLGDLLAENSDIPKSGVPNVAPLVVPPVPAAPMPTAPLKPQEVGVEPEEKISEQELQAEDITAKERQDEDAIALLERKKPEEQGETKERFFQEQIVSTITEDKAKKKNKKGFEEDWEEKTTVKGNDDILAKSKSQIYLKEYLEPWKHGDSDEPIEFLFDNAELSALIEYVEQRFRIKFIMDDDIQPLPQGAKSIMGTKISFRTHKPLSRRDAWNLFVAFLDMAGFTPVPGPGPRIYKLMASQDPRAPQGASRSPLPLFIGVDPELVPNNDTRVRYVYFVVNTSLEVIKNVVASMQSVSAPSLIPLPELNAVIITDKGANVRAILAIVKELDQANMPETLAVVKLKHTDASKAAQLYNSLVQKDGQQGVMRFWGPRRQQTVDYFSEGLRVIPEPRSNSLILLGSQESVKKVTNFIVEMVDKQSTLPLTPVYTYHLKFLDAEVMAKILNETTQFQPGTEAAKAGGVRDGDKYLKQMIVVPEKATNSLIINADYDDYSKIKQLIEELDVEQPQVILKVFILGVDLTDQRQMGMQLRNKKPGVKGLISDKVNFQTSGLVGTNPSASVVENTSGSGSQRLLGDLINLASQGVPAGSTLVTLGSDVFGVWGILNMLQTYTHTTLIANPFLTATHKYQAEFSIGERRRVQTSTTSGTQTIANFGPLDANLNISIVPQVSREDLVTLNINIDINAFTDANVDSTNGNRILRNIRTSVIIADNEVLALGGLVKEQTVTATTGIPILKDIPLIGWLFKNRSKSVQKTSLLILVVPEIIRPKDRDAIDLFTRSKILDSKDISRGFVSPSTTRDPVHRWFFNDQKDTATESIDEYTSFQDRYNGERSAAHKKSMKAKVAEFDLPRLSKAEQSMRDKALANHTVVGAID